MATITDPALLTTGNTIFHFSGATPFEIELVAGVDGMDEGGVTLQALYSYAKDQWREDDDLIKFRFPFVAITGEQFEVNDPWDFAPDTAKPASGQTKNLIRDAGWALRDSGGTTLEEYMNITSLGLFNDSETDQAYYLQVSGSSVANAPTQVVLPGEVNQAIQIFSAATLENFNYRNFFRIYLREQGKTYGFYDLNQEQNIPTLTFRKYALPLVNAIDLKITTPDAIIATGATYTGMSITYLVTPVNKTGFQQAPGNADFSIIIDGNNGTAEQIYEFVQYKLRQAVDINTEVAQVRGDTADELLRFVGDTLRTLRTGAGQGVYIENFKPEDTNRIEFTADNGLVYTFPFVAAGNLIFNDNLQADALAKYFVFFTDDKAADVPEGKDFGTVDAILINDNDDNPITGLVDGNPSISFSYDYDGNVQRGTGSGGEPAPFTGVAIGTTTAQYVVTVGTIQRTTANVINFVAALERNYLSS